MIHSYNWPGNVRELEHTIEHVYILSDGEEITAEDFLSVIRSEGETSKVTCSGLMPLKEAKWEVEKQLVTKAYEELGSTYKVAKVLKVDQSTVVKLLHKHA